MRPNMCVECAQYAYDQGWALRGACASVGIEHGKSTEQMLAEFIGAYHARGHQEASNLPALDAPSEVPHD